MKSRLAAIAAYLSKSGARAGLIAAGVLIAGGVAASALTGRPETRDTVSETAAVQTPKKAAPTAPPAAPAEPAIATPPSTGPTPPATKLAPAPAPAAKPAAPAAKSPAPASGAATPGPNAIKYVVQTGATVSYEPGTGPIRLRYSYSIVRDGSYTMPVGATTTFQSGPGASGAMFCSSGGSGDNGTTEMIFNHNAPVGIYTCGLGTDVGYTRYETRFRVERTETTLTILPGNDVIPGRPI